jgi:subtilisin family serine protease
LKESLLKAREYKTAAALLLGLAALLLLAAQQASAIAWQASVDPLLLALSEETEVSEFIVMLEGKADLSQAATLGSKAAKGDYVVRSLLEAAKASQSSLLTELSSRGIRHQPFWIINAVWVQADATVLQDLAMRQDVKHIYANPQLQLQPPFVASRETDTDGVDAVEPNIALIGASELWQLSIDGRGVVIGGQDTGYEWDHPALKDHYRGWDGQNLNNDYSWHDAIHSDGGVCGADSPFPCDDNGHGTHTMGIMVGDDGGSNKIGVAPGAKWIGCRNMDRGMGTPLTYIECFQWFIAPTAVDGSNPDPSMAPDIINNSWSCPPFEGCTDPEILREAVEAVRAAGILTIQSAGNGGSLCATISTPAAIYDATFTVGATTNSDQITNFSSRGPVTVDESQRAKPDVVAPGSGIRSSYRGNSYTSLSGTSMAAPHVAGLAALLISASPELAGQVGKLELIITASAVPRTSDQDCSGLPGDQIPNAAYGYGRIDAVAAVRLALGPRFRFPLVLNDAWPGGDSSEGVNR